MSEVNAPATLTGPAGSIGFNRDADVGVHDVRMCSGLGRQPTTRPVFEDKPRTHGVNVYPTLYGARHPVLGGWVRAATLSARSTWFDQLADVLDSIMAADGTYAWETSIGTKVCTVRCEMPVEPTGGWLKKYQFGLVSTTVLV